MRLRSSSAPTVRSRPNQRALSTARAAGSTKPLEQLDVALGEVVGLGVLDGEQADDRPAGREHGVHARREPRREAGPAGGEQVRLVDERAQRERRAAAAAGSSSVASRGGQPDAVAAGARPRTPSVSSSTSRAAAS